MFSARFSGLTNSKTYFARVFVMGKKGAAQTEIGTQVASAKPVDGQPITNLAVGSVVTLKVGGVATRFIVVHHGLPSSLYDSSCNGTWLLMESAYQKLIWDQSNNDYENSDAHAYLNGAFYNLFDADTKAVIKQVKIPYRSGTGSGGTTKTGANGLPARVFLLGGYEMGWTTSTNSYFPVDGAKLSYFGTASTDSKRIGKYNGAAQNCWMRSAYTSGTGSVWYVNTSGGCASQGISYTYYIRPALVLDSGAMVSKTQNSSGSYAVML